jgi:acetyl esterase
VPSKDNSEWLSQLAGKAVAAPRRETLEDLIEVHEDVSLRPGDGRPLTGEIYVPEGAGPFPVLVHLHGGGFCVSRARNDRKLGTRIAERGYVVLNVEYALAPEHPFPAALEDAVYGARWIVEHATDYRGDPRTIVLEGGSAGANLALTAALALGGLDDELDGGGLETTRVQVSALLLFYGIFSFPLLLLEPGSNVGSAELWNRAYLGPHFTQKLRHPLASPVYAPTLDRLPPTYLSCGSEDSLLGHSLDMTRALAGAGVRTTLSVIEGANHGFAKLTDSLPAAAAELERAHAWLSRRLEEAPAH